MIRNHSLHDTLNASKDHGHLLIKSWIYNESIIRIIQINQ